MATSPIKFFSSWSATRYGDWLECPLKAKLKHLDKIQEPIDPKGPMARGNDLHANAANFIMSRVDDLHPDLEKYYGADLRELRALFTKRTAAPVVEDDWVLTAQWEPTHVRDWDGAWLRVKLDCGYYPKGPESMRIKDWKTGKFSKWKLDPYMLQLEIYAVCAFVLNPHLQEVIPSLEFVDEDKQYPETPLVFKREQLPALKKLWEKRLGPMMADRKFDPKPGKHCDWCYYGKKKVEERKTNGHLGEYCKY